MSNPTPTSANGISIVVPTFKRVDLCQNLLESLQVSIREVAEPTEILLIDNSPPEEAAKIKQLCDRFCACYHYQPISVSAKRSFGGKIARYDLLLFIDSDCEAAPNAIASHCRLYREYPEVVAVLGKTEFKGAKNFLWRSLELTPFLVPFHLGDREGTRIWGPSNNLSCRKTVFQKVGGFDSNFPNQPGGEDVDFGYRLYRKKYLLTTCPDALVYHTTETWLTLGQVGRRLWNWGRGEVYVYDRNDEFLYYDCPKGMAIVSIAIVIGIVLSLLHASGEWLLFPAIFLGVNFVSRVVLHLVYNRDRGGQILQILLAETLGLVYECGVVAECWRRGWFVPFSHRLIALPEEALWLWNGQLLYTWVTFAQLLVSVAAIQAIMRST